MSKDYIQERPVLTDEEEEFAALFAEESSVSVPFFNKGEMVKGRIISIGFEVAFIDLGGKAEGIIDTAELKDMELSAGDEIEAMVLSTRGGIRLSRTLAGAVRDRELLEDAYRMGLPVEGRIEGRNKGGFDVLIGGLSAFLPVSHLDIGSVEDLDAWIGRTERFKILEFDDRGKGTVVSRANLIRAEREEKKEETWEELAVGQVRTGVVRSLQTYGCFVDIGGVDGLLHIKEMQWGRLAHPSDLVEVGQEVSVTVTSVDREEQRVGLSMKSSDGDPWKQVGSTVSPGSRFDGVVTRVEKYGAFVELLPGLEGLVHVSELTFSRRVRHPNEVVSEGDRVAVTVLDIDAPHQRISLSMKQLEGDPWEGAAEKFPIGVLVHGRVERTANFGVFVEVAPGMTALLPRSETGHAQGVDLGRYFRPGDVVNAVVLSVDAEDRRMSISTNAVSDAAEAANVHEYQKSNKGEGNDELGTFAELLKGVKIDS